MERLFRDFDTIKKDGLAYCGRIKRFVGRCSVPLQNMQDAFGFYYSTAKSRWVLFVTDFERGLCCHRDFCDAEEDLEGLAEKFDARERYIAFHEEAQDDPEACKEGLDAWLSEYGYTDVQKERTIAYLIEDGRIFFEAAYRALTGELMPECFAAAPQGKSVRVLCRDHGMILPAAFCYQVYLGKNPKEALENLERGLPRK